MYESLIVVLIVATLSLIVVSPFALFSYALWIYVSDEHDYEYPPIDPRENLERSIPTADTESQN